PARFSGSWRCCNALSGAGRGGHSVDDRASRQPGRAAAGSGQRGAAVGFVRHVPFPSRVGRSAAKDRVGGSRPGASRDRGYAGGTYRFDFTENGLYRVQGAEIDYDFYFGPTPKEIFEEHNLLHSQPTPWMVVNERFGTWAGLKASLLRIVQGAMSAANAPVF